jgi:hypothetical protein
MNIERPTPNDEWSKTKNVVYDLEEKLLEYTTFISQRRRWPEGRPV